VTRLGEFSPFGLLLTFSSFLNIMEEKNIFGLLFSMVQVVYDKKWLGYIFGDFFKKLIWPP
jgi:hypothetical protein